jgi:glutamine synthetase
MDPKEILRYVQDHPSGKVKIAFSDMDGVLRGKYISTAKFLSVVESGCGFCDVIFGWDMADLTYNNTSYTGWHTGYPDAQARIDLNSFRKIPWENDIPFFLGEMTGPEGEALAICPRQLLKKILEQAQDLGFNPCFSQEFEWYNFDETPHSAAEKNFRTLRPLTPGMFGYSVLRTTLQQDFFTDLFDLLKKFDLPLEGLHTETGPGTYEAAIACADLPEAGDRAILFKTAVKEIAYRRGIMATFMAKISENLPGCGGHIHQSLQDKKTGRNLFFDAEDPLKMSLLMKQYTAGQLYCLPFLLPLYAPTVNSYKRLVEGGWAPTTITWGIDNRTVALRILNHSEKSCRLETRVVGADVNPYLAMAAALASGLYGIKNKLYLEQSPVKGNGYLDGGSGRLPPTLEAATQCMKDSAIAKEMLGEDFTRHFIQTREWEWKQHLKAVTDWELRRYFEII